MWSMYVRLFAFLCLSYSVVEGKDQLRLKIIGHQPCNRNPKSNEKIRCQSMSEAAVEPDTARGPGWYKLCGKVEVFKQIKFLQVYAETKYGTKAPLEQCKGADKNNCGGVGSCVYCDACNGARNISSRTSGLVHLQTGTGKNLDCRRGLKAGTYKNVCISFGMPTKEEVLKTSKMAPEMWDQFVASGRLFFLTLYIFCEPVNQLSSYELQQYAKPDGAKVCGCHRVVGSIYEE